MKVLTRYLLREHLRVLVWILFILCSMTFLFDFLERWDDVLENKAPALVGLKFLAYRLPQFMPYILPISVLLSTFITLGLLNRSHQITALKASGISGHYISRPFLITAALLSLFSFFWTETIVPYCNRKATETWQLQIRRSTKRARKVHQDIWIRIPQPNEMTFIRVGFIQTHTTKRVPVSDLIHKKGRPPVLKDITLLQLDPSFRVMERIDANELRWEGDRWVLKRGIRWGPDSTGRPVLTGFKRRGFTLPMGPEEFKWVQREAEEMGFFELRDYLLRAKREGFQVTPYLTELHFKVSSSLFCLITVLFTIPLAVSMPPKAAGMAAGVALSMVIGFVYYVAMALGLALGKAGILPPWLGAWGANIVFATAGCWLMIKMRQ